jgi:azurin
MRALIFFCLVCLAGAAPKLELRPGDRICLIGNTLADRMQHVGWLETYLHSRFPEHELVVRNLGFSADELTTRPRSMNFGDPHSHLRHSQADVVFAFFGYNESFAGEAGLDDFGSKLRAFVAETRAQTYNGKSPPRLVLFSPIAHEDLRSPHLPDGKENNARLRLYTQAMAAVAKEAGVEFVDLFNPTHEAYQSAAKPLTMNGIHPTPDGYQQLAGIIESQLFGVAPARDPQRLEQVRQAVLTKNLRWFNRYRATDGYSTYGQRAFLRFVDDQTNFTVMQHELKMLDVMTANRDKVIWAAARGETLAVDGSNVPAPIPVISNVGGGSRGSSAEKEGSLIYLSGEGAISKMQVAKGMRVNLFASEEQFPELVNPVQSAVDTDGRLWVSAWATYPHWHPNKPLNDKLLILPDEDGDGKADRCITFADALHNPTGFEFWNGGVLVACAPQIFFLRDTDGDDRADERIDILQGIDSADTHCGANSFTLGPDGNLYFSEGIFHFTNVETPWGPPLRTKAPMLYRWNPRSGRIANHFYLSPNPHGIVIDEWGHLFATDGTTGRGYYAGYPGKGTPHELYKKRVRPVAGFGQITGSHFPEENRGNLLICNTIGVLGVLQHKVTQTGADFTSTEVEPIVLSSDKNFRPVDVEIGGDGALYVLDWQNVIIGHMQHNIRDPNRDATHGRVYRVTADGRPLTPVVKLAGKPIADILPHLASSEHAVRYRARIALSAHDRDQVLPAARRWANQFDVAKPEHAHHLLEVLWLHQQHDLVNPELLKTLLASPHSQARAAATRVLAAWNARVPDGVKLLLERARDDDAHVRAEALVAAVQFDGLPAAEVLFEVSLRPTDPQLDFVIKTSRQTLDPIWKQALDGGQQLSPVGQQFLLRSADTKALLKLERSEAVCRALLIRNGVPDKARRSALSDLAAIRKQSVAQTLIREIRSGASELDRLLSQLPESDLRQAMADIVALVREGKSGFRALGALLQAGVAAESLYDSLSSSDNGRLAFVAAIPSIASESVRASLLPTLQRIIASEAKRSDAPATPAQARYVRIEMPRKTSLTIAEVQIFVGDANIATQGQARQSSTNTNAPAQRAIDGNTDGRWDANSSTHTQDEDAPWWEVDLGGASPIDRIVLWNRTDCCQDRLAGVTLRVLDAKRQPIFTQANLPQPDPKLIIPVEGVEASLGASAVAAIAQLPDPESAIPDYLCSLVADDIFRAAAVSQLLAQDRSAWPQARRAALAAQLVKYVRSTPVEQRDTSLFRDSLALGNALAEELPGAHATAIRDALRGLQLQEITVKTVVAQMKFDLKEFTVTAGRGVKIHFENIDHMPHNLLIGDIGSYDEIGRLADLMAADPKGLEKQYIPDSPLVLFSTDMIPDHGSTSLKFIAPSKPGDYTFICTFPGHWRVMHGIMKVVVPEDPWVHYKGPGKRIVLVSGDEEYRSEESLPQLAKILNQRHGFDCTVLFAIDPETGEIDPEQLNNIPGLEALDSADLAILNIRFRDLPPGQMRHIDAYLKAGKPILAIRPTLAGFVIRKHSAYAHYDWHYKGPETAWQGGFGQLVLGQTWIAHHGKHRHQGTRGLIADSAKDHPIQRGIADGDIWGSTDVYRTPSPVPADWTVLVNGQSTDRRGPYNDKVPHFGQRPDDPAAARPSIQPIAWLRQYQLPDGKPGQCFYETIGASAASPSTPPTISSASRSPPKPTSPPSATTAPRPSASAASAKASAPGTTPCRPHRRRESRVGAIGLRGARCPTDVVPKTSSALGE